MNLCRLMYEMLNGEGGRAGHGKLMLLIGSHRTLTRPSAPCRARWP